MANANEAIDITINNEVGPFPNGGYANNPNDPGGETKWGICRRQHPDLDIKNLTRAQAKDIYLNQYWEEGPINDDHLADKMFDLAVRCGKTTAIFMLQHAVNDCGKSISCDGHLGPKTAEAVNSILPADLWKALVSRAEERDREIVVHNQKLSEFLKGWIKRDES